MLKPRITTNNLPLHLTIHKPDEPKEKYIRANYMQQVINNIEAQKDSLTKEEMLSMLRQAVEDYTNNEGFVVISGENKPSKPKLTLVS